MRTEALATAASLMTAFAERTGLGSARPPRRYLWTDAFAVGNFLALGRLSGERRHVDLALALVDQVHHVLGRHRSDEARRGWISGLGEREGESHPTCGGLRIGKQLPERGASEPFDERLEWERDGQYFHYLTRWMHALAEVAAATGEARFLRWARELAKVAHASFVYDHRAGRRMVWKRSIDLARTLVPSMGQHDPLDGFVACLELATEEPPASTAAGGPDLGPALVDFADMLEGLDPRTGDPLGLGGLLSAACRLAQLADRHPLALGGLIEQLLGAAQEGLAVSARSGEWEQPASRRLAFRELGLAIGLSAVELLRNPPSTGHRPLAPGLAARLDALAPWIALRDAIVSFWLATDNRATATFAEHRDINEVILATSLLAGIGLPGSSADHGVKPLRSNRPARESSPGAGP